MYCYFPFSVLYKNLCYNVLQSADEITRVRRVYLLGSMLRLVCPHDRLLG